MSVKDEKNQEQRQLLQKSMSECSPLKDVKRLKTNSELNKLLNHLPDAKQLKQSVNEIKETF